MGDQILISDLLLNPRFVGRDGVAPPESIDNAFIPGSRVELDIEKFEILDYFLLVQNVK